MLTKQTEGTCTWSICPSFTNNCRIEMKFHCHISSLVIILQFGICYKSLHVLFITQKIHEIITCSAQTHVYTHTSCNIMARHSQVFKYFFFLQFHFWKLSHDHFTMITNILLSDKMASAYSNLNLESTTIKKLVDSAFFYFMNRIW